MKVAYLEPIGGLSGDMTLGALVDVGLPIEALEETVEAVGLADEIEVSARSVTKAAITATKVDVAWHESHHHEHEHDHGHGHGHHHGRSAAELMQIVEEADLEPAVIERSLEIMRLLAEAEAKVHDTTPDEVHFHELGGFDTIVDVVGAVEGVRRLGIERLHCGPLPIGHGWIDCAHGRLPVPAPATAELLANLPTRSVDIDGETVTPTGAALAAALADGFGRPADFTAAVVGYGAGDSDFDPIPNLARLWVSADIDGEQSELEEASEVTVIEANIDDMSGELAPHALDAALAAGALDAWTTPIVMKKGRPALLVSAICEPDLADDVAGALLRETTSLGVRMAQMQRRCLHREIIEVDTRFGTIGVKVGYQDGERVTISPEHDHCLRAAQRHGAPTKMVYAAAVAGAQADEQATVSSRSDASQQD